MDKLHLSLVISLTVFLLLSIVSRSMLILPVYGFGLDVHKQTTSDVLSFLKPEILDQINQGHDEADSINPLSGHQFYSQYHFDNCNFREGVEHINQQYTTRVVPNLDPKGFGVVLHASMDFYAHSNWVELGKSNIIDNGDGLWNPLTPGANIGGLTVLEGEIKNKNFLPYPA